MKKIITIIILITLILSCDTVKAGEQESVRQANTFTTDSQYYQQYLYLNERGETFVYYHYKGSIVTILVPRTRLDFIKLEHAFIGGQLNESHKYYKTVLINLTLIKWGLEPLYY